MARTISAIIAGWIMTVISIIPAAAESNAPHNAANTINCGSCHGQQLLSTPFWGSTDDLDYDRLCLLNCHTATSAPYTDTSGPKVGTHSSVNTSDQYGTWEVRCLECHDPHTHQQFLWKRDNSALLYLASGRITNYSYDAASGTSTLTTTGVVFKAGWDVDKLLAKTSAERRAIVLPNVRKSGFSYPVIAVNDPDPNTITVKGDVRSAYAYIALPTDFAIIYGQYIRRYVTRGRSTYPVKFFDATGTGSFVDGNVSCNGICQVCHTQTAHFRRIGEGGADGQDHANVGGAVATDCISCHPHTSGFKHGGGSGTGCDGCHGHDAGYGGATGGKGTFQSHSTHTENDADDAKDPNLGYV